MQPFVPRCISDNLNPTWGTSNAFTHRWEVELVSPQVEDEEEEPPVAEFVPLTWDRMTSAEQMVSNMQFFIQAKFLGGRKCEDAGASPSAVQQKVCRHLAELSEGGVDGAVVREVAAGTEDEELKASLAKVEGQIGASDGSLAEVEAESSGEGHLIPGRMGAIHAARRRRRPRPYRGGGRHHGGGGWRPHGHRGGGGGGWGALIFVLLFIILLPIGL
ncbi:unnamed protein product [Prorocentrum cordatum]|uniref:C2 domain-containing protein n=1 Tax=Prorocentrum cordatum TaxID=2364126 RepID=A0ABN9V528_9DINO|nr:unnamed protein product [Polarella glacialis]